MKDVEMLVKELKELSFKKERYKTFLLNKIYSSMLECKHYYYCDLNFMIEDYMVDWLKKDGFEAYLVKRIDSDDEKLHIIFDDLKDGTNAKKLLDYAKEEQLKTILSNISIKIQKHEFAYGIQNTLYQEVIDKLKYLGFEINFKDEQMYCIHWENGIKENSNFFKEHEEYLVDVEYLNLIKQIKNNMWNGKKSIYFPYVYSKVKEKLKVDGFDIRDFNHAINGCWVSVLDLKQGTKAYKLKQELIENDFDYLLLEIRTEIMDGDDVFVENDLYYKEVIDMLKDFGFEVDFSTRKIDIYNPKKGTKAEKYIDEIIEEQYEDLVLEIKEEMFYGNDRICDIYLNPKIKEKLRNYGFEIEEDSTLSWDTDESKKNKIIQELLENVKYNQYFYIIENLTEEQISSKKITIDFFIYDDVKEKLESKGYIVEVEI